MEAINDSQSNFPNEFVPTSEFERLGMLCSFSVSSLSETHQKRELALPLCVPDEPDAFSLMNPGRVIHPSGDSSPFMTAKSRKGCAGLLTRGRRAEGAHERSEGQVCRRDASHTLWSWITYSCFIKSLTGHHLTGVKLPAPGVGGEEGGDGVVEGGAMRFDCGANRGTVALGNRATASVKQPRVRKEAINHYFRFNTPPPPPHTHLLPPLPPPPPTPTALT